MFGNNYWLGSRDACTLLNRPLKMYLAVRNNRKSIPNVIEIASPIPVEYRVFYLKHESKFQVEVDFYESRVSFINI